VEEAFIERAGEVGKAILPFGVKLAFRTAGRVLFGSTDLVGDVADALKHASDEVDKAAEQWVEEKLKNHEAERRHSIVFGNS
jgi:hypothetical protein